MHPSYHCQSIFLKHKSDCLTPLLNVTYEIALELYKWPFIVCPSLLSRLICQQSLPALTHGHTHLVPGQITLVHISVYFKFCSRGGCPTSSSPLSSYDVSRPRPSSSPRWGLWPPQAIGSPLLWATTAPAAYLLKHLLHCAVIVRKHIPFSSTRIGLFKCRVSGLANSRCSISVSLSSTF